MVILFDRFHLPTDIYEVIFSTPQQVIVAKLLINKMKEEGGSLGKTGMSMFATQLHDGIILNEEEIGSKNPMKRKIKISYNKRQFYDRILTPMRSMGMIDYDMYKKKYAVSNKLNNSLIQIGLMWGKEVSRKQPTQISMSSVENMTKSE